MPKATRTAPAGYDEAVALYDKLVATNPRIERKGDTMPYTSLNGNMFSVLTKDGVLCLRLAAGERDSFSRKYKTKPVVMYGTVMKEYVAVPPALLAKTTELKKYFDSSYAYAMTLKTKPTKQPKAK